MIVSTPLVVVALLKFRFCPLIVECILCCQIYETDSEACKWFPICLSILGNWLAETQAESPKVIMDDYLSKVGTQIVVLHKNLD